MAICLKNWGSCIVFRPFNGEIPQSLVNMSNLKILDLGYNQLFGQIPSSIFKITSLKGIYLDNNSLSGSLPHDLCIHLPKLEMFYLDTNELSGHIPPSIGRCSNLQILALSINKFDGIILRSIGNLTRLEEIYLGVKFYMKLAISLIWRYWVISLFRNSLSDGLHDDLCHQLPKFEVLQLHKNELYGNIPPSIGRCSSLQGIPPISHEGGRLRSLNLNGNQLEGSIPTSFVNCKSLQVLDLGNNNLNDSFPYWLGKLPNLQVLVLRSNRFHGRIQDFNATFSFSSLRLIDLSQNDFTGRIPPALFDNLKAMWDPNHLHQKLLNMTILKQHCFGKLQQ
ncbi:hypothetical protein GQ457_17G004430 [Hibiscus cannabinus]